MAEPALGRGRGFLSIWGSTGGRSRPVEEPKQLCGGRRTCGRGLGKLL